jgi:hypothetical protein
MSGSLDIVKFTTLLVLFILSPDAVVFGRIDPAATRALIGLATSTIVALRAVCDVLDNWHLRQIHVSALSAAVAVVWVLAFAFQIRSIAELRVVDQPRIKIYGWALAIGLFAGLCM